MSTCYTCSATRVKCPTCNGKGMKSGGIGVRDYQCPNCKGKGECLSEVRKVGPDCPDVASPAVIASAMNAKRQDRE